MRIVLQEAENACVVVDKKVTGAIERGEVVLVGFGFSDDEKVVDRMLDKMLKLRIFPDESGLTNVSLENFGGSVLAVSQFTLYADLSEGNRPSFANCLPKEKAQLLFSYFSAQLKKRLPTSQFGIFHADMRVTLTNVGPFTILLDSDALGYGRRTDHGK